MPDSPTALTIETPSAGVALVRLNRPKSLNALNEVLVAEFQEMCATIGADRDVRVVVLTGTGRGFCAGLDVRNFGPSVPRPDASTSEFLRFQEMMAGLPQLLRALPQPVVAAVNGPAVGAGLALCLASDVRLCGESASFGNGAILLGLSGAEMGMSYFLPRIVGLSVAADWMLTGRTVSSAEAYQRGLVSELVDDDRLVDRALELAGQIAAHSPLGVQMTKRALQTNTDASGLGAALELENRNQVLSSATDESTAARQRWTKK